MARRTMADVDRTEDRKRILLELLRLRFETLPLEMEQAIKASQDGEQVEEWMRRFATAKDLEGIGIVPPAKQRS